MSIKIIGISAFYHDSAAVLLIDGKIVCAAQEERFSRIKHDSRFPLNAIRFCLDSQNLTIRDIDYVVYYEKPFLKFERLLETYLTYAPKGFKSYLRAIPVWIKEKLFIKKTILKELDNAFDCGEDFQQRLRFTGHHQSHAASAFFPSPFNDASILCLDGVGEWATTTVWKGEKNRVTPQWEINFPHSIGLLYSAFTYYTGFRVNSGEYKLMGLAPYGEPEYVSLIKDNLIDIKPDGTFRLNMAYFGYATDLTMTNDNFHSLFKGPPRKPESELTLKEMNIARSIQVVTEEIVMRLAKTLRKEMDSNNLCLSGGVALNCVANGKLSTEKIFDHIWVQPAAGDAGGALGAALLVWHEYLGQKRETDQKIDQMQGCYLGPEFSDDQITACLKQKKAVFKELPNQALLQKTVQLITRQKVVGWFQGKMEFGPRALGNRSILGDPRNPEMQTKMNLKIKFRESFRPFAPAVKSDKISDWFQSDSKSPYMLFVSTLKEDKQIAVNSNETNLNGFKKLTLKRSLLPSITHVDYSARVQTVHKSTNPKFYRLLDIFEQETGCPVFINTSFNVRGEPIVCTPDEAFQCFVNTDMDYLVMGNYLLSKEDQPEEILTDKQFPEHFMQD